MRMTRPSSTSRGVREKATRRLSKMHGCSSPSENLELFLVFSVRRGGISERETYSEG